MALLFMDGFDHLGTGASPATAGKWVSITGGIATSTTVIRTGTQSLLVPANTTLTSKVFPASGAAIVGAAVYLSPTFTGTNDLFRIQEDATVHMAVGITSAGLLTVKRGGTVLATGTTVLAASSWYFVEFKTIIHDTTGSYEVRIDGVTEAALTNAGPTDTRNGGTTGQWNTLVSMGAAVAGNYLDDLYVCDGSGSAPRNTFLGPCKIETIYPQTDAVAAGSNAGLTCSTGTDHGALVDETPPNTTDYNSSATVGLKDTYNYPSLSLSGTVLGIQTNLYCAKSDAAARSVCAVVRTASVDTDGANVSPLTTWSYFSTIWAQNPNAGSPIEWTSAEVATLQAGMKVTV